VNSTFRLKKNEDFQHVISLKKRSGNQAFTLYLSQNKLSHARVGISTSKKLGNAVVRNRIRRQVRSMIQHVLVMEQSIDLVIIVKNNYLTQAFELNQQQLIALIRSLGGSLIS
jgi:ribonuclease P protein component